MSRFRFSIVGVGAAILMAALAFTALRSASEVWVGVTYTYCVVLLLIAVIAARLRRGGDRAFWFGFAVFGWGFFLLGMGPWVRPLEDRFDDGGRTRGVQVNEDLLTAQWIVYLIPKLRKQTLDLDQIDRITINTMRIAHLLVTLGLATVGGIIATLMAYRARARRSVRGGVVATSIAIAALASAPALATGYKTPSIWYRFVAAREGDPIRTLNDPTPLDLVGDKLRAMGEGPLQDITGRDGSIAVYRLLVVPTFDHPFCVRIEQSRSGAKLRVTALDCAGGYANGGLALDSTIRLRPTQWEELNQLVRENEFWRMPKTTKGLGGEDGVEFLIEGREGGRYHRVHRDEAMDEGFAILFSYMMDLSGVHGAPFSDGESGDN